MNPHAPLGAVPVSTFLSNSASASKVASLAGEPAIARLIVGVGEATPWRGVARTRFAPWSLGAAVITKLLLNSGVEEAAVHRVGNVGMSGHLARSNPRLQYEKRQRRPFTLRADFQDFNGTWCDRLLLGHSRARTAVLVPVGPELTFDSVGKALSAHSALNPPNVLFVSADASIPFGRTELGRFGGSQGDAARSVAWRRSFHETEGDKLQEAFWLRIGIEGLTNGTGSDAELQLSMKPAEWSRFADTVAPRAAYVAALWVDNPATAMGYANRQAHAFNSATAKIWTTLQSAMPPFADHAVRAINKSGRRPSNLAPGRLKTLTWRLMEQKSC